MLDEDRPDLNVGQVEVTALAEALIALRNQWRADRQTFSQEVIFAVAAVIRETEEVFDLGPVPINDVKGAPFTMEER
jgi:hypothetical protein